MSHAWKMLLGCLIAFGLLFLLPVLGLGSGASLFVFLIAMFLCHAMMIFGHKHRDGDLASHHKEHNS